MSKIVDVGSLTTFYGMMKVNSICIKKPVNIEL